MLPETPNVSNKPGKRRGRKLVNKTFMDETGFMVTKKEYVSCSEEEPSPKNSPVKKVAPKEESVPNSSSQKNAAKKQSNIKNFFKKM